MKNRIVSPFTIDGVRKRDGICLIGLFLKDGCVPGYDAHHITTKGSGGDDIYENMICLCRKHHNDAHAGRITKGALRAALARFYGYAYTQEQLEEA